MKYIFVIFSLTVTFNTYAFERCAVAETDVTSKMIADLKTGLLNPNNLQFFRTESSRTKIIPVIIHTIEDEVEEYIIDEQMDEMNNAYALTGFRFELVRVNHEPSTKWSRMSYNSQRGKRNEKHFARWRR